MQHDAVVVSETKMRHNRMPVKRVPLNGSIQPVNGYVDETKEKRTKMKDQEIIALIKTSDYEVFVPLKFFFMNECSRPYPDP